MEQTNPNQDKDIRLHEQTNILSSYDSATYNFTFYLAESSYRPLKATDSPRSKVIIAESGVTGDYSIGDVTFTQWVAPGHPNKNTSAFKGEMIIHEPNGFSLFDSIFNSAQQLSIKNFTVSPFFLDVDFKGYDPVTGNVTSIPNTKRTYRILLTGANTKHSSKGTVYTMKFVSYNDYGYTDRFARFDRQIDLKDVSTIGELFDKLSTQLNTLEETKSADNVTKPNVFSFVVDPVIRAKKLRPTDSESRETGLQNSTLTFDSTKTTATIQKGISVGDLANSLCASVEKDISQDSDGKPKNLTKLWFVRSDVTPLSYDTKRNDYVYKIEYKIDYYHTTKGISDASIVERASTDRAVQSARKKALNINKMYYYTYTGKNTEVLDFEIDLDYLWFASIPVYDGIDTQATNAVASKRTRPTPKVNRSNIGNTHKFNPQPNMSTNAADDRQRLFASHYRDLSIDSNSSRIPVTVVHTAEAGEQEYSGTIEPTTRNEISITNAMLNQVYDTSQLVKISLDIKGDPYWLGGADFSAQGVENSMALDRDDLFIIKFKTPTVSHNTNGLMDLTPNNAVAGAYSVNVVESTFSNGKFTQTLTAFRDMITNIKFV